MKTNDNYVFHNPLSNVSSGGKGKVESDWKKKRMVGIETLSILYFFKGRSLLSRQIGVTRVALDVTKG